MRRIAGCPDRRSPECRPHDADALARIARLSAAFLGSNLARAAIGFGLSFALARGLGAERFGRWILCTAWASTLTVVVDLGFGVLLTRDGAARRTPSPAAC